jgi:hypothetical protein
MLPVYRALMHIPLFSVSAHFLSKMVLSSKHYKNIGSSSSCLPQKYSSGIQAYQNLGLLTILPQYGYTTTSRARLQFAYSESLVNEASMQAYLVLSWHVLHVPYMSKRCPVRVNCAFVVTLSTIS